VALVANPDYFEGRPYLSRVVYRIIPSQSTIFLELNARGVDYASLTAVQFVRQTNYPAFRKAFNKYQHPANAYTYFGFNLKDPRFADRRIRQAFAHAINKQELIDGVILGLGREATGPYKPGTWVYNLDVARYPYNPARALQQVLALAAGTFLYVGASDLLPEAHRRFNLKVVGSVIGGALVPPVLAGLTGA
jgi:peptide/nickel transport system substrate-binding protein